jgi:hypothetical protein
MEKNKIDKVVEAFRNYIKLKEDGIVGTPPTNNLSSGKIAGTPQADPGNPPVFKKKDIYLGIGSRKRWMKPKN